MNLHRPLAGHADLRDLLRSFVSELSLHVCAAPQAGMPCRDIGYQLADTLHLTPWSFRATVEVLARFLQAVDPHADPVTDSGEEIPRWISVLAEVVEGYAAGARDRALGEQGEILAALASASGKRQRELLDDARRFEEMFTASPVAMGLLDPTGRIREANAALAAMLAPHAPVVGTDLATYIGGDTHAKFAEHMFEPIRAGATEGSVPAFPLTADLDRPTWVQLHWATPHPRGGLIHSALEDITDHYLIAQWLQHQANHDHHTGLPNRRYLDDRLTHLLSNPDAPGTVGIYGIRLDGLTAITASLGPAAGRAAFQTLTDRATRAVATSADLIAQLDPITLAIVITRHTSWATAADTMKRLVDWLAEPIPLADQCAVSITPAIGAAQGAPGHTTAEILLHCLNRSLLNATQGRPAIVDAAERDRDEERNRLLTHLPAALDAGDITVLHSPIARAETGQIVGSHVTPQWTRPERWPVPVAELVELAAPLELSAPVVSWCLDQALGHATTWRKTLSGLAPFLRVDLPHHLTMSDALVDRVLAALRSHGFPADRLQLAVSEFSIIDRRGELRDEVLRLNAHGVRLVLKDLGVTVSRFDLLPELYLQGVIIAPQLTAELEPIPRQGEQTTLQAMIGLGATLNLEVDLLNINTRHEGDLAHTYGVTNIQGSAVGDPQPAADIEHLIRNCHKKSQLTTRRT